MDKLTFEATTANFQERVLNSATPVLVDFWADWCPPCKMISPLVDEIAQKYEGKLLVAKLDYDANPEIGMQYFVQGLPTLLLFQNGEAVKRILGYKPVHAIEAEIVPFLEGVEVG